ncbi:MAG TPA: helix-turn-helix transcriptional regulator [Verrucomicrobiae bacterium]|jgi:transcriptional regulator with XRE-family HTH domain|nr:helix-turn-helix transcriptional regulator [Verrucomicrobiae bacterium]
MSKEIRIRFGKKIRQLRMKQALTQMQLAERVGMAAAFLSRVEAGEKEPCLGTIEALAQGLNVPLRRLFWDL